MKNFLKLITAILVCELVGLISIPFTISAIPTWYATLNKPSFSPPNWLFGPVWTLLYSMMGVSAYLVWREGLEKKDAKKALLYFVFQLICNFLWSFLFFYLRSPILAFADIVLLWILIVLTMIKFYKISKAASYLLLPYLLWVSFASILNLFIIILN